MGGTGLYHPPVKIKPSWFATWLDHTNRTTPSTEPGLDVYVPRETDLFAAASGVVVETYYGIGPATGRYIAIDLDDGKRVRYLHLETIEVSVGQRVAWGQYIGKTGATGYGDPDWSWDIAGTGGAHVHMTVFFAHRYTFGRYATADPFPMVDWSITEPPKGWDEMATKEEIKELVREALNERTEGGLSLVSYVDGGIYLWSPRTQRSIHIESVYHATLIQRALKANGNEAMYPIEHAIVNAYCLAVEPPVNATVDIDALAAKLNTIEKDDDAETIAAALKKALAETTFGVKP